MSLYTRYAARSDIAYLSELLTGIYIRDMHFNGRYTDCLERIGNGNAGVRVSRRVYYDTVNYFV